MRLRWREADGSLAATMAVALAGFTYALLTPYMLMDGDTGWHLATGRWILAHAAVPTTDPFSFSAPGRPWVAHEWLSETAMVLASRAAGWSGLAVLIGAAFAALLVIVGLHLRRWLGGPGTPAALALLALTLMPTIIARPHVLALPILAGWIVVLLRARERDRAPSPGWALLMLVWANAHGSFMLGLSLAGAFALDALIDAVPDRRCGVVLRWGAFGALCAIAAVMTPGSVHGLAYPFYVSRLALLPYIQEWRPTDFSHLPLFEVVLLVGLFVLLVRPTRIAPVRLMLLLGTLHLALEHTRQVGIFVVLAILILAEPIGQAWSRRETPRRLPFGQWNYGLIAVAALLAAGLATARIAMPIGRADSGGVPATALRHLPLALRTQRVFNEYSFGGALILAGIRPYIDGRSDMYGDAFSIDYFEAARGNRRRWHAADRRWHFGWTMLPPDNPLVPMLDADPHWRRSYADATAVIHVRR